MSQLSVGLVQCTLKSKIVGQPFSWAPASSPNDVCCVHVWQCLLSVIIVPVRNVASVWGTAVHRWQGKQYDCKSEWEICCGQDLLVWMVTNTFTVGLPCSHIVACFVEPIQCLSYWFSLSSIPPGSSRFRGMQHQGGEGRQGEAATPFWNLAQTMGVVAPLHFIIL